MKRIFLFLFIPLIVSSCYNLSPCIEGSGPVMEEERDVSDFYSVSNTSGFNVFVSQADTFSVVVEAQESLMPFIESYRSGSTLILKTRDFSCLRSTSSVNIYVSLPEIEELHLTGSGQMECPLIIGDIIDLDITGSGRLYVDSIYCNELYVRHTSSGNMEMLGIESSYADFKMTGSGKMDFGEMYASQVKFTHTSSGHIRGGILGVEDTDITMTGSGHLILYGDSETVSTSHSSSGRIDALEVIAEDVTARATGSGNTYVHVNNILDVTILGSGDVIYAGSPTSISTRITGSGNLRQY